MSSYKLPDPPPHSLKNGDIAFSSDIAFKEFVFNITRGDDVVEIELLNRDILKFKIKNGTWWLIKKRARNSPIIELPIEYLLFFSRITKEIDRDIKINDILL